jgi:hypothetical protein
MMKPIQYFIETRGNCCENCGSPFTRENIPQRHHCLLKRDKRYPELDHEINIELLGQVCCHSQGFVNSQEHAEEFARRQIARGYDVRSCIHSLPLKYIEDWLLRL